MRKTLLLALAAVLLLGACGKTENTGGPSIKTKNALNVGLSDYAFSFSGTAKAGTLALNFDNTGKEMHMAAVGRIDDGKTLDDVKKFLSAGPQEPPAWFDDSPGDLSLLSAGQKSTVVIDAKKAGTYVMLCFLPTADGKSHIELGMLGTFDVKGTSDAPAPAAAGTVTFDEKGVTVPSVKAGSVTLNLKNGGKEDADFNIIALAPGKKLADVDAWFESFSGPLPATFHGGTHGIPANGGEVTMAFTLTPGTYTAVASYENPDGSTRDIETQFTVS